MAPSKKNKGKQPIGESSQDDEIREETVDMPPSKAKKSKSEVGRRELMKTKYVKFTAFPAHSFNFEELLQNSGVKDLVSESCVNNTKMSIGLEDISKCLGIPNEGYEFRIGFIPSAIHYPRSTVEMWHGLIQNAKDGGLDAIETYIFWDRHEPVQREYNFSGNLDFVKFFKLIQEAGLYAIMRIGPYACAEWNYGGFPLWLHNIPGIELRTNNEVYKKEMQIFTTKIVNVAKEANLLASQGGPTILAQIQNEY
ncbi:hypothetical protein KIW84_055941 [Lathyrus oleraceus]|uniref:beta-galactosidase n=1 Tax=Pisum sativum TaxID=3888 RepID=A0A9D4X1R2_PEA|nr:hypothetical protein KIW84_UN0594 [Pisum sativum]KAI5410611.1 hypothetical protein KIW84_055941 [Pisum sativum]